MNKGKLHQNESNSRKNVDEIKENAKIGYQATIDLWSYEGQLIWSKYNALLVANSIVLAVIGLSFNSPNLSSLILVGMPISGVLLCITWFLLTKRGFDNYKYWIFSARELEEKYLNPPVKTVSRGGHFTEGKKVLIEIDNKNKNYQMSYISRKLKAEWSSYLVIGIFAVMYFLILFF